MIRSELLQALAKEIVKYLVIAGLLMYLVPVYIAGLAYVLLGEAPQLFLSNGDGTLHFAPGMESLVGFHHAAASGDIDNNGSVDILVVQQGQAFLLVNDGAGHFSKDAARMPADVLWKIEPGRWWLRAANDLAQARPPLTDRLEWAVYGLLSTQSFGSGNAWASRCRCVGVLIQPRHVRDPTIIGGGSGRLVKSPCTPQGSREHIW